MSASTRTCIPSGRRELSGLPPRRRPSRREWPRQRPISPARWARNGAGNASKPKLPPTELQITASIRQISGIEGKELERRQIAAVTRFLRHASKAGRE